MSDGKVTRTSRDYAKEWVNTTSASIKIGERNVEEQHEQGLATCLYLESVDLLKLVLHTAHGVLSTGDPVAADVEALGRELGRLHLWGESLRDGSLDEAIDQSDELRCTVLALLRDIGQELLSYKPFHSPLWQTSELFNDLVNNIEPLLDEAKDVIDASNQHSQGTEDETCDDASTLSSHSSSGQEVGQDESQILSNRIAPFVQDLMDLSPTIESNLIPVDQKSRIPKNDPVGFNVSTPARTYVSLVMEKFPKASQRLIERLGEANWQRHVIVRDRLERGAENAEKVDAVSGVNQAAIFSQYGRVSLFHDSGLGTTVSAKSQGAVSTASHSSFTSTIDEGEGQWARVPPTPSAVSQGKPFRCGICFAMQARIRNRIDWKMHVFTDLQPYVCTFPACSDEMLRFSTRNAWAQHEFDEHRVKYLWNCTECDEELANPETWRDHLRRDHECTLSRAQLEVAAAGALRCHDAPIENEQCLLCQQCPGKSKRNFIKHVCRHMEEIALVVLPRDHESDDYNSESESNKTGCSVDSSNSRPKQDFSIPIPSIVSDNDQEKLPIGLEVIFRRVEYNQENHADSFFLGIIVKRLRLIKGWRYQVMGARIGSDAYHDFWTSRDSLIPLTPSRYRTLRSWVGLRVLARYPDTTAFYRGLITDIDSDKYQIRFDGDESYPVQVSPQYVVTIPSQQERPPSSVNEGKGQMSDLLKDILTNDESHLATRSASGRPSSAKSIPSHEHIIELADPTRLSAFDDEMKRVQKHPGLFQCNFCPKKFTRTYKLGSHLRTHTDERPFICSICNKSFAREHYRKRHEGLHSGEKKYECSGMLANGVYWGCSRRFVNEDALARHHASDTGRVCLEPLHEEAALERGHDEPKHSRDEHAKSASMAPTASERR